MSERPESMFCGDCIYYVETDTPHEGVCKRYPAYVPKVVFDHCGEFRAEWPARAEDIEWPADALTYPQGIPWHGSPAGEDLKKGDAVELRDGKWWKVNDA